MYNEGYFDAVHFFRYFLLDGGQRLILEDGTAGIAIEGDFPSVNAKWPKSPTNASTRSNVLDSDDEDDVLDALVGSSLPDEDEWDWGAEHARMTLTLTLKPLRSYDRVAR